MEHGALPRNKKEQNIKRFFEILPGAVTWTALLFPIIISPFLPSVVAIVVLIFDLYWFLRSINFSVNIIRTYFEIKRAKKKNWYQLFKELPEEENRQELNPEEIYQAVVLVFYKEPLDLLRQSISSYAQSNYDNKRKTIIVIGGEERAGDYTKETFLKLKKEFESQFYRFELALHPADIPGEIKCKSANATWAAKHLKTLLDKERINYRQVIIHNFDADTRVHRQYFSYVAYRYLTESPDQPISFQPIHLYTNNIWETPAIMRIVATSSTFTFMYNAWRPHRFRNFSSRSDVFQTIIDIGYYVTNAIPEDSRQYMDMYFKFKGKVKIIPIYIPLGMDAVLAEGYFRTMQNQYRQLRRWAWGVSDVSEFALRSIQDKQIPWREKFWEVFRVFEGHFSWATSAIYIGVVGWLPILFGRNFSSSVLGYNLPHLTRTMLNLAAMGLIITIVLSFLLYRPKPKHKPAVSYLFFLLQWVLVPIVSIFFSAFAAIDAQTRLMLGRYMEYQITEKKSVKS